MPRYKKDGTKVIASKAKGNRGEREVVHILKNLTGIEQWYRVPGSGNAMTGNLEMCGDVYSTHPDYLGLVIEVKNHKGFVSINDFFNFGSPFRLWVEQLKRDCKKFGYSGYLFFKSNGKWFWYNYRLGGFRDDLRFNRLLREHSLTLWHSDIGMLLKSDVVVGSGEVDG